MKEKYEYPVAEVVELTCDDIIMTSISSIDIISPICVNYQLHL